MTNIIIIKRTVLSVLLTTTLINPLYANQSKSNSLIEKKQKISTTQEIKNILVNKGLCEEVTDLRVSNLFKNNENKIDKLSHLYNNPYLSITKENLYSALSTYALYEKHLDLNSFSSVIGLIQSIKIQALDKEQLEYIKCIV
ncbi:MAG: 5'-3' exonuclease [Sulfurimonas sp.]|jgi:5'-3' exonuclease